MSPRLTIDDLGIDDDTTTVDLAVELADYDSGIWPDGDEHPMISSAVESIEGYTDPECGISTLDEAFACYGRVPVRLLDAVLA